MALFDNDNTPPPRQPAPTPSENEKPAWMQQLLSWKGAVGLGVIVILGLVIFGGSDKPKDRNEVVSYSGDSVPVGVSDTLNQDAVNRLGVDLTANLDPGLVPAIVAEAMKEVTQKGVSEADFVPSLVSGISNKIRDISTIDLNADGLADPVIVMPTSASSDQEFIQFSIRVPDPAEVSELPSGTDQDAWRDIAENKSIEIMTASATKSAQDEVTMQSQPNPQVYNAAPAPYYHHSPPGLGTILLTSMMMSALFSPPFMGYGGYAGGPPTAVTTVERRRAGATSSLASSSPSQSTVSNSKGQAVGQSNFKQIPPKTLNQAKTAQFRARQNAAATRSGGFGSSSSSVNRAASGSSMQRSTPPASRNSAPVRRSGGFGKRRR
jgi:hypothetical protein